MKSREDIIRNYIAGYNEFDVAKMTKDLHQNLVFENWSNGELTLSLTGLDAFRTQAEQAKSYFVTRTQSILFFTHQAHQTRVEIDYAAVLAMDFPNGLKKGDAFKLRGQSIFTFSGTKIIKLTDKS